MSICPGPVCCLAHKGREVLCEMYSLYSPPHMLLTLGSLLHFARCCSQRSSACLCVLLTWHSAASFNVVDICLSPRRPVRGLLSWWPLAACFKAICPCSCFFEEKAHGNDGKLKQAKHLSINKIGHGALDAHCRVPAPIGKWVPLCLQPHGLGLSAGSLHRRDCHKLEGDAEALAACKCLHALW